MNYFRSSAEYEQKRDLGQALLSSIYGIHSADKGGLKSAYKRNADRLVTKIKKAAIADLFSTQVAPIFESPQNPTTYGAQYTSTPERLPPVLSLTTISTRLERMAQTIQSLISQTEEAHSINLYVSTEPYLLDEGIELDSKRLKDIHDMGVNIYSVPNIGPYRKQVPVVKQMLATGAPMQTPIITFDDDVIYPPTIVADLTSRLQKLGVVIAHRGRRIQFSPNGKISGYKSFLPPSKSVSMLNLGTGKNGIAYRLGFFNTCKSLFAGHIVAPTADDIWCKLIATTQGIPTCILEEKAAFNADLDFPESDVNDKISLYHKYNKTNSNDDAMAALDYYFSAISSASLTDKYPEVTNA